MKIELRNDRHRFGAEHEMKMGNIISNLQEQKDKIVVIMIYNMRILEDLVHDKEALDQLGMHPSSLINRIDRLLIDLEFERDHTTL
ncbi:hypothetical protein VNO78_21305 [Psophocarpus tetragonolobus]|uniref:Uncharacterized protein n=1 Tax=Psophocarpus tetragonolobus TaxID=3891 RepID=A0AAN9SD12_PSOTE